MKRKKKQLKLHDGPIRVNKSTYNKQNNKKKRKKKTKFE